MIYYCVSSSCTRRPRGKPIKPHVTGYLHRGSCICLYGRYRRGFQAHAVRCRWVKVSRYGQQGIFKGTKTASIVHQRPL